MNLRDDIFDDVLKNGGDSETGYFPGCWVTIGAKHRVYGKIVKDVWEKFVTNGSVSPRKRILGKSSKLGLGELQLVEAKKTKNLSIAHKHIRSTLLLHGNLPRETSVSAVGRAVWTWKRMSRSIKHTFTEANVNYSQDYLNFIS